MTIDRRRFTLAFTLSLPSTIILKAEKIRRPLQLLAPLKIHIILKSSSHDWNTTHSPLLNTIRNGLIRWSAKTQRFLHTIPTSQYTVNYQGMCRRSYTHPLTSSAEPYSVSTLGAGRV